MQRSFPRASHNLTAPFSILGRIGGDATRGVVSDFQRPVRFQYPRSDRRRCNCDHVICLDLKVRTFSILGRIGGDATKELLLESDCTEETFSILGRIGGDATTP